MAPLIPNSKVLVRPEPLTASAFAPYGNLITAPLPSSITTIPYPPPQSSTLANQNTALRYTDIAPLLSSYRLSPSGTPAAPHLSMYACFPRPLHAPSAVPILSTSSATSSSSKVEAYSTHYTFENYRTDRASHSGSGGSNKQRKQQQVVDVHILERHPYTTQTFVPFSSSGTTPPRSVIVVAPSLPVEPSTPGLTPYFPQPTTGQNSSNNVGLPDLSNLRAFIIDPAQHGKVGVTYGAGVWHAPMLVVGEGTRMDYVVAQWMSGRESEDVQEVETREAVEVLVPEAEGARSGARL